MGYMFLRLLMTRTVPVEAALDLRQRSPHALGRDRDRCMDIM